MPIYASGYSSFEVWKNRTVYKAQCKTAAIANQLQGIKLIPGQGIASILDFTKQDALVFFRALKPYRNEAANALRLRVAEYVRAQRRAAKAINRASALR